jgi:hypothetical protein
MPGAQRTRSFAWNERKPHEGRHHRFAGLTRHSLREWF